MTTDKIAGKTMKQWINAFPALEEIMALTPVFWRNPECSDFTQKLESTLRVSTQEVNGAVKDFDLFSAYIATAFPETGPAKGIIESDLVQINAMQQAMETVWGVTIPGRLYLKKDSHLAVSGSIKARGGFYEVLKHAQHLALENGLLASEKEVPLFQKPEFKELFSQYAIGVGSTGNLGLSIGIMGKRLGFKVYVHMSADARQWKKDLLRSIGVEVIEHPADYTKAVEYGRNQAQKDPRIHFVDDENSRNLFLGYATSGQRLSAQLKAQGIGVDDTHPLFVYLPCGVGGGPGGITVGLKQIFGDHVHCFFAEPTHSPCVLLGLLTKAHDRICVQDVGIDNLTAADGLAVGRPSKFVGKIIQHLVSGVYTLADEDLFRLLVLFKENENIYMEPSAMISMAGPVKLFQDPEGHRFIVQKKLSAVMENATHIVWGTGGSMVPEAVRRADEDRGKHLLTRITNKRV